MASNIKTLKDQAGNEVLPRTKVNAITNQAGDSLQSLIDAKSVVTVSDTGSSVETVKYITINGTEKKLPQQIGNGSFGSGGITDFVYIMSGALDPIYYTTGYKAEE